LLKLLGTSMKVGLFALVFVLFASSPPAADAQERDAVQFANNIVIHEGEEVHDAVCFLCSIENDGTVHGDMVAFAGNIRVRGHAEHDAVAFLGSVSLGENASIDHDVVVFAGSLRNGPGSSIGRDRVVFPLFLFLVPLLFVLGFLALIVWSVRALMYRNRPVYPMPPPRI